MFPNGLPGAGLLLLRLVCGLLTIAGAARTIIAAPYPQTVVLSAIAFGASMLLLAGLWTPIAGICVSVFEAWAAVSRFTGIEVAVLLATIGAALAALGPGAHSVDARLYGRKRIEIQHD
jgi:putative oxidoreductase